ncbi:hypothetical protein ABIB38_004553 [Massilia sp. UYP11]|uniref:hypothetical protein n=1 Tax=Massilia sp. UYP11 TaxID=1756385 RepID=UPI003D1B3E2A
MGISLDSTVETGYQTISKEISGLVPDTESKGLHMPCIATKKLFAAIAVAVASLTASAAEYAHPPKYLVEPVFGLKVEFADGKLEPLPEQIRAACVQMADNETWTGRQWIFGAVKSGEATYYLVSGYFERRHPGPGELRYHQPDQGGIYVVKGKDCGGDPAREVFEVRDFEQIPKPVLERLARDAKARLVCAIGGESRLRAEFKKQRVTSDRLTPELAVAFKPYF